MSQPVRFTRDQLRSYFLTDFALGKDFAPSYDGDQLVETKREGGCFVQMDFNGAPILKAEFVDYLDATDNCHVTHARMLDVVMAMRSANPATPVAESLNLYYAAIRWWALDRRQGVTQEQVAERFGVTDRSVRRWLDKGIDHVADVLRSGVITSLVMLPEPVYNAA